MTALRRALGLVRNASLAATVSARHLREDPLHFAVQSARRLPCPAIVALTRLLRLGRPDRPGPPRWPDAVAAWLTDHPAEAAALLTTALPPRTALGRRLTGELALQVGATVPEGAPSATLRARAAWLHGDVTGALTAAPDGALRERYRSEAAVLRGEARPHAGGRMPQRSVQPPDAPAVLHVLTNSLPHTSSGYTARTHSLLRAQQAAGMRVAAATRLAYPVSVGRLTAADSDLVDTVRYDRLLPWTMPRTLDARLQEQTDRLAALVRRFGPTSLHTTTDFTNALVTRALAEGSGLPWVYEVRGLLEDTWVARRAALGDHGAASTERYHLLRDRETEAALAADRVVTLSRTLADELVRRGVPAGAVTVVPNAVDDELLTMTTSPEVARVTLGLPRDGFWVGTVSSLVDYEGLDTLLDAVALLRSQGVDARACVVGDGVSRPSLEAHAASIGLGGAAVFPGRVDRATAVRYHQALDIFAVPRRDTRVCRVVTPLKPVEAMACGRPVIASDLPALAELVEGTGAGALVPAGDVPAWATQLAALADDAARREKMGAAGRELAAGRTWDAAGRTLRVLHEELVA